MDTASPTVGQAATPPASVHSRKRPVGDDFRRGKRGKYTAVACDECKKKKLKCIPTEETACQRCVVEELACVYAPCSRQTSKNDRSQEIQTVQNELLELRSRVVELENTVTFFKDIKESLRRDSGVQGSLLPTAAAAAAVTTIGQSPASSQRDGVPKEPQFVGPTRSAFGIIIGERSLTQMGIPTYESLPPSGAQSPANESSSYDDYWQNITAAEVASLLAVFQDEVESVYPILDIGEQAARADQILHAIRHGPPPSHAMDPGLSPKDVDIVKVAMATAIVLETHGKSELSTKIVQAVENNVQVIARPEVDLKEIQLVATLSIYYFHCGDDLLAWRTIGIAARGALELGLHRKKSLFDIFKDEKSRRLAIRVFCLSFALVDRDVDSELPEPDGEFPYLNCMVRYGRLCSKLWDAIPPFGSQSQQIPEDVAHALDASTQDWLYSIPPDLQLRHPRLGLAPLAQPRTMHRIRTLLYLRGNHTRTLIYRHHLLSAQSIAANKRDAQLVVDIAQDSIHVLVHLNATSNIYSRQQNAFNYFLLSALSIVFLAVCHAPDTFTALCRKSLLDAVELVRGFSRNSPASRRLWNSVHGLLQRLRSLGLQSAEDGNNNSNGNSMDADAATLVASPVGAHNVAGQHNPPPRLDSVRVRDPDANSGSILDLYMGDMPDMSQVSNELLSLFDVFGQGQVSSDMTDTHFYGPYDGSLGGLGEETLRGFQDLI
ncbi:hypothetical protein SCUCBS95973_000006 [Sporothrix curviconia]|uniref:Zn(2)-C6 fungal-type domain-containing protein n=1 Tax=Sporothrix curviconia TaxID=1260050 RepID=A0ABP0AK21_9PEZI